MVAPKLRFKEFSGEWKKAILGDISTFTKGKGLAKSDIHDKGKYPCIRYGELYTKYGNVINKISSYTNISKTECILSQKNQILIPASGETQLDIAKASCILHDDIILGGDLNILTIKENGVFFAYYLSSYKKNDIAQLAQGNAVVHLYAKQLKTISVNYPNISEQTKIAKFLIQVDKKIDQLTQKQALLTQYKKGMMQKLFSQQIRFKADDGNEFGEWKLQKLRSIIIESKDISLKQNEYDVLTSSRKGLIKQSEYFEGSRLIERDNIGFNLIKPMELTYRSRSDDGLFFFNINKLNITGTISTYYPVFNMQNSNNTFFVEYLNFNKFKYRKYAVGTSQLVLSLNQLKEIKFNIPTLPEQTKIANFLSSIDQKIDLTHQQLQQAKQWKKGLLQQMFV